MAKAGRNKNYVSLTDVRVYWDKKTDTIKIMTADPDLTGQPFLIELHEKDDTEDTLRTLLTELEVIPNPETETPQPLTQTKNQNNLQTQTISTGTELPTQPDFNNDNYDEATNPRQYIPIGQRNSTQKPLWVNLYDNPNTLILGNIGDGTRRLIRNIHHHFNTHNNAWKQIILDLDNNMLPLQTKNEETTLLTTLEETETALDKIFHEIDRRFDIIDSRGGSTFTKLKEPPHNLAFIILNYQKYFTLDENITSRITHKLNRLTKLGHKVGIHVITHTTTKTPEMENITSNYQNRIYIGKDPNSEERATVKPGQGLLKTTQDETYNFTIYKETN